MSKIILVPIEPLESRYTGHWYTYLPSLVKKYTGRDVVVVRGHELETTTTPGAFLNFSSTVAYKSTQMNAIASMFNDGAIRDGDTFLFTDFWNPAAHFVRYMADLAGIKVTLVGICHAGAYDPYDLLGQRFKNRKWANALEMSFDELFDKLIFATDFSRYLYLIGVGVDVDHEKHLVTGFPMEYYNEVLPMYWDLKNKPAKENIVVFPHRISPEKQPEKFVELSKHFPDYKFVFAQEVCNNKQEYHDLLYRSKMMFSDNLQETLGIGTFEALFAGCDLMVPDRLSYSEMYPAELKFGPLDNVAERMRHRLEARAHREELLENTARYVYNKYLIGGEFYRALREHD